MQADGRRLTELYNWCISKLSTTRKGAAPQGLLPRVLGIVRCHGACCWDHSHGTADGYIVIYTSPTPHLLFPGVLSSEYMYEWGSTDSVHTKACHSRLCLRVHGGYCSGHWSCLKMSIALTGVLM